MVSGEHHLEDVSQAYKLYITICILIVVLFVTTALRVWSRLYHSGVFTADDGLIVLGTCFNIIADGMELFAIKKGFGRHAKFVDKISLILALKYTQLGVLMAALAIWSIKVSVCFFLLGLLRDVHRRFRLFIWILMAFTTVLAFIGLLLWGLQAHPLERLWDPRVKGTRGSSQDFLTVVYIFYAFNLFTDIVYSLTPIWFLWNVQISKRKKRAIWVLMSSALLLTVAVTMCIIFAPQFLETEDITWALIPEFIADW
ncbi:hypothetical protein DM02DRAFT_710217 [Periconia macrospinosa]|uniref:Rhodopsin domain-containing protein n=1 Tax=Periconia macrospinosa TaxID=97972 RepID=A0A2V1DP72_9PLEO|nr:hypothetical protein DM02DRAFT_710217 [Periconia macrospinosa]